jgi:hypothetical protein
MELFLFVITLVSVATAGVASFVAWRMTRAERARSEARVAALAGAIDTPGLPDPPGDAEPSWALHRVGSVRPGDRALRGETPATSREPQPVAADPLPDSAAAEPRIVGLFGATEAPEPTRWQLGPVTALVGVVALAFIGSLVMVTGGATRAAVPATAAAPAPLELLSLRHAQREGTTEITGLVRNPAGAATIDRVTAVVFFFDASGGFLASSRAPLDFTRLTSGEESPFVVVAQPPSGVSRYRVSFRRDDGVVPHVDRREKSR